MKHRRTATAILCTSLMLGIGFLSGCGSDEPPELEIKECSHTDENHDKQCDKCGNEYYIPCTKHADTDGDAKCDFCGKTMTPTADEPESPEEDPENPQDSPSIDDKPESPKDTPSTNDKPQIPEDTPNNPEDAPSTDDDPVGLELITDSTANINFIYENGISSSIIKLTCDIDVRNSSANIPISRTRSKPGQEQENTHESFFEDPYISRIVLAESLLKKCDTIDIEIMRALLLKEKYIDMAEKLHVSESTVKYRLKRLLSFAKLDGRSDLIELMKNYLN